MKKLLAIFMIIVLATVGSFAFIWAMNPAKEKQQTLATQGIRLLNGTEFATDENGTKSALQIGSLVLGSNEQIFRINEIRKTSDNSIYVVVSWKFITDYSTYADFTSQPYVQYTTFELNHFMYGKTVIAAHELAKFYDKNNKVLEEKQLIARTKENRESVLASAPKPPADNTVIGTVPTESAKMTKAPDSATVSAISATVDTSAPRNINRAVANDVQAYSVTAIQSSSDMDKMSQDRLDDIIEKVKTENSTESTSTP